MEFKDIIRFKDRWRNSKIKNRDVALLNDPERNLVSFILLLLLRINPMISRVQGERKGFMPFITNNIAIAI